MKGKAALATDTIRSHCGTQLYVRGHCIRRTDSPFIHAVTFINRLHYLRPECTRKLPPQNVPRPSHSATRIRQRHYSLGRAAFSLLCYAFGGPTRKLSLVSGLGVNSWCCIAASHLIAAHRQLRFPWDASGGTDAFRLISRAMRGSGEAVLYAIHGLWRW